MCLPDGKRIEFHLIRRASATPSLQGESKERSYAARGKNGFHSTLDTGFTQKTYP